MPEQYGVASAPFGTTSGQHAFSVIPENQLPRSSFDRSFGVKTAFDSGFIVPMMVDEILPGDTINLNMQAFIRLSTPINPIMDNIWGDFFVFFCPNRLLWDNWQKFNGEQKNPGDSTSFVIPQVVSPAGGVLQNTLFDHIGIPIKIAGLSWSALFGRMYNRVYNEWFRDENLQNSVVQNTGDGPDTYTDYALLRRGKRHDYFTSCLPFPQKGAAVSLPLGTTAPVISTGDGFPTFNLAGNTGARFIGTNTSGVAVWSGSPNVAVNATWGDTKLVANLAGATAATINQIREAFQVQRLLEKDARGGTRYTEIVRSHWGVISPDARLNRPEFLGGGSIRMNINPVANQAMDTITGSPLGTLGAFGVLSGSMGAITKTFTEHGILMVLCSVRADLNYQQGINRMFKRNTRFEFFWPSLAHLGEQAVLNQEIFAQGTAGGAADTNVFGYQERYAEYRYKPSEVRSVFRSDATQPIDNWHLAQDFASLPALNSTFIVENAPFSRVLAVTNQPQFFGDLWFTYRHARIMPTFGVPGLIDHF